MSVDWRQELRDKCIQSVINLYFKSDNDGSDLEDDVDDAMEINWKLAVISGEALETRDKLQLFFKEHDAENKLLRCVVSLTTKVENMPIKSKEHKTISDFFK